MPMIINEQPDAVYTSWEDNNTGTMTTGGGDWLGGFFGMLGQLGSAAFNFGSSYVASQAGQPYTPPGTQVVYTAPPTNQQPQQPGLSTASVVALVILILIIVAIVGYLIYQNSSKKESA